VGRSLSMPLWLQRRSLVESPYRIRPAELAYFQTLDRKLLYLPVRLETGGMQKPLSHSTWASALDLTVPPAPHLLAVRLMRLRRGRLCPPCFPAQTPSLPYGGVIICAVLTCALGRSAPLLPCGKPDAPLRVRRSSRDKLIVLAANPTESPFKTRETHPLIHAFRSGHPIHRIRERSSSVNGCRTLRNQSRLRRRHTKAGRTAMHR
jgi:hypothetical protein